MRQDSRFRILNISVYRSCHVLYSTTTHIEYIYTNFQRLNLRAEGCRLIRLVKPPPCERPPASLAHVDVGRLDRTQVVHYNALLWRKTCRTSASSSNDIDLRRRLNSVFPFLSKMDQTQTFRLNTLWNNMTGYLWEYQIRSNEAMWKTKVISF